MMKKQANPPSAGTATPKRAQKVSPLMAEVLQAARLRCDAFGDPQEAREQMKRDVLATPPELLADLLVALSTPLPGCARRATTPFQPHQPIQPQRKP